jgi:hypothetical protein
MVHGDGHTRLIAKMHGNTSVDSQILTPLWDPVCTGKGSYSEAWRGYQRAKLPHGLGYATVIQEWYVEHLDMRPPTEPGPLARFYNPHKVLGGEEDK